MTHNKQYKFSRLVALCAAGFLAFTPASLLSQELSESHLAAAKKAISVTSATKKLNEILPTAAARITGQLIGNRPDIESQITIIVNETALELATRRGDLEKEAAKIYARTFSEEQLQDISTFFATESGQKFLTELPIIVRELDKAARVWGTGISRDLAKAVNDKMKAAGLQ